MPNATSVQGKTLDGGGGYTIYGYLVDTDTANKNGYIPLEMPDKATVVNDLGKDDILTYENGDLNEGSFIYHLRRL